MREVRRLVSAGSAARAYGQADVFAIASFAKGIPVIVMEAMAMEIACMRDMDHGRSGADPQRTGWTARPPGEEVELARGLGRLMDDSDLRLRVAKSPRQRVLEHYDLNRNCRSAGRAIERTREC
jgi:glycosyltransferase involved in cell wall biosynthesis